MRIADRYDLGDEIGHGAMGRVYRAVDRASGETVAVKVLRPDIVKDNPDLLTRFEREGEALRRLDHPNIVKMLGSYPADNALVMEYVPGGSLQQVMAAGIPVNRALRIALELADALSRAHLLGIIHRDLKPANVLIAADDTPLLTDFGVAHMESETRLTQDGSVVGTYAYLSPEACMGREPDPRSDIWSFGVILFEMLTGSRPFEGASVGSTITSILTDPTPDMSALRPDLSEAVCDLVYRMLTKDINARIPSVRMVGAALEAIITDLDTAELPQIAGQPSSPFATPTPGSQQGGTRLPTPATPFVGRVREVAEIIALVSECRSVTLLSPGGMGKTRLGIEVARRLGTAYPDGAAFVPLAPVAEPSFIAATMADVLGVEFQRTGEPEQQLLAYLQDKHMLLVMDNFEHLLEGTAFVARLVETAPQVRLIVTSRARLNITAECTYEVPPMVFPTEPTEEVFEEFEAVELFVSYARRAQPNYELAAEDRPAVVRLCQLIGGVPLGLELAAAWMRLLSPAEIADEVATNLDFLETDAHDVADRHRSLRAVFDYSWDLLPEAERDAFVRLSVFRGGFTREFAREVSGASLRTLLSLVDKSLITRQPDGRFQIHEYLRQYGENRLAADPQLEKSVRDAHANTMVSFLASQRDGMLGPNLQQALDAIGAHLENIRASWLWVTRSAPYLLNGDLAETYRRSIDAVWLYYDTRSLYKEGVALFETAVEGRPYHDVINPHTRALTAIRYGAMHGRLGAFDKAEQYLQIGIKEAEQAGWPLEINRGKVLLGFVYFQMGHNREAIAALEEALPVIREIGEPHDLAHCLLNLGFVRLAAGQPEDGARLAGESVDILRRIGALRDLPFTLISLGSNLQNLGQIEQARDLFTEALQHARTIKTRSLQGYALMLMGINAQVRSALFEAREHFNAGHAIFSSIGDRYGLVTVLDGLNQIAYEMGDYEEAAHAGLEALRVAETAQMGERLLNSIFDLANAYTALGRFAEARALNERALEADVDIEQRLWGSRIGALNNLSEIARAEGDLTQARQRIDEAYDLVMQTDMEYPLAYVLLNRGRLAFSEGDLEAALSDGEAARTRFESFGLMRPQINARNLLVAVHARLGATDEARALLAPIIEQAAGSPYHPVKQEMLLAAAELMRAFGEREQAAALVGHVMTSETAWAEHKSRAARLLDALDLEADTRQRAVSRGEAASADDLLATVRTVVKK